MTTPIGTAAPAPEAQQGGSLADRVRGSRTVDLANPKPLPFGDWAQSAARAAGEFVARPGVQETPYGKPAVATVKPGQPIPNDLASRPTTAPARAPAPAPAPAAAPKADAPAPATLPDWAHAQAVLGGGDPKNFQMAGSAIISARSPEQISRDYAAHPPITTDAGRALVAPAPVPSIGVQGAPVAVQANPGVPSAATAARDPAREAMVAHYRAVASQARNGGQGQWVFPPGTGTEPTWQQNHAHDQAANAAQALAQYDSGRGQFMQHDPGAAIAKIDAINATPERRATALALGGMNAQEQAGLAHRATPGEPADTQGNYDPATAGRLADPNIGLMEHATHFAANPGQSNTAAFQDWINKHYSTPKAWDEETSVPPDPGQYTHPLGTPGVRAAGLIHSIFTGVGNMFGAGGTSAGTGLGWQQNRADRLRLNDMLSRIGVHAPPGTVNAGIPPQ